MKIDHRDIQDMREFEDHLNNLRREYEDLWCRIECENSDAEECREKIKKVVAEIIKIESELDIVGGFNGE